MGGFVEPQIHQNRTQNESKFKTIFKSEKVAVPERLGAVLGRSWGILGASLGPLGSLLGVPWGFLGDSWGLFRAARTPQGAPTGALDAQRRPKEALKDPQEVPRGAEKPPRCTQDAP